MWFGSQTMKLPEIPTQREFFSNFQESKMRNNIYLYNKIEQDMTYSFPQIKLHLAFLKINK